MVLSKYLFFSYFIIKPSKYDVYFIWRFYKPLEHTVHNFVEEYVIIREKTSFNKFIRKHGVELIYR